MGNNLLQKEGKLNKRRESKYFHLNVILTFTAIIYVIHLVMIGFDFSMALITLDCSCSQRSMFLGHELCKKSVCLGLKNEVKWVLMLLVHLSLRVIYRERQKE